MAADLTISSTRRKLGKTELACAIAERSSMLGHSTACIKLRRSHGDSRAASGVVEGPGRKGSDTWRYALAGAGLSALITYQSPEECMQLSEAYRGSADLVIWETNSMVRHLDPDLSLLIRDEEMGKGVDLLGSCDIIIDGPLRTNGLAVIAGFIVPDSPAGQRSSDMEEVADQLRGAPVAAGASGSGLLRMASRLIDFSARLGFGSAEREGADWHD